MTTQFEKDLLLKMNQNRIIHKYKKDKEFIKSLYKNESHLRHQIEVITGYKENEKQSKTKKEAISNEKN